MMQVLNSMSILEKVQLKMQIAKDKLEYLEDCEYMQELLAEYTGYSPTEPFIDNYDRNARLEELYNEIDI